MLIVNPTVHPSTQPVRPVEEWLEFGPREFPAPQGPTTFIVSFYYNKEALVTIMVAMILPCLECHAGRISRTHF
jgi:hypothetical protein